MESAEVLGHKVEGCRDDAPHACLHFQPNLHLCTHVTYRTGEYAGAHDALLCGARVHYMPVWLMAANGGTTGATTGWGSVVLCTFQIEILTDVREKNLTFDTPHSHRK